MNENDAWQSINRTTINCLSVKLLKCHSNQEIVFESSLFWVWDETKQCLIWTIPFFDSVSTHHHLTPKQKKYKFNKIDLFSTYTWHRVKLNFLYESRHFTLTKCKCRESGRKFCMHYDNEKLLKNTKNIKVVEVNMWNAQTNWKLVIVIVDWTAEKTVGFCVFEDIFDG